MLQEWEEGDGRYLAPELLTDGDPTPAADIFSLGATLFQCITGELLPLCLLVCLPHSLSLLRFATMCHFDDKVVGSSSHPLTKPKAMAVCTCAGHVLPKSGDAWTATAAMQPSPTSATLQWLVGQMCDAVPKQRPSARDILDCVAHLHMPFALRPLAELPDVLDQATCNHEEVTVSSPETPGPSTWRQQWLAGKCLPWSTTKVPCQQQCI